MLHPPVLFLGDRPSPHNLSPQVAFVGTKSYKVLLEWIYRMDININEVKMVNLNDIGGNRRELPWDIEFCKVITLGTNAAKALEQENDLRVKAIKYFALPHPSGLNRELNDKKKLNDLLTKCRNFVYGRGI